MVSKNEIESIEWRSPALAEGEEDGDIEWWGIIVMICLSFASFKNRGSIYN